MSEPQSGETVDSDSLLEEHASQEQSGFWTAGHTPTPIVAFLYFDLAFMVGVLLGPRAPDIAKALTLTPAEKGLMVAPPHAGGRDPARGERPAGRSDRA